MRHILSAIIFIASGISAFAQSNLAINANTRSNETTGGTITGMIRTADEKPAAFVTVYIKAMNRAALTDENGVFVIRHLPAGIYTLEVTMVGLKPIQKTILLEKNQQVNVAISLLEDVKQLTEVVVATGRRLNSRSVEIGKISINPMDLPQAVSIIGAGVMREQQAQRLSDVIKNVNGVYLSSTRGNVQESFAARGYNFSSSNLFKNGVRINSGVMPEMSSLERVEVLKGSAAILFGQVAPGGIINMATKEPSFKKGGEVSLRAGSFDLCKPAIDVFGPLSKSLAYRVNGTAEFSNSFRDQVTSKRYYLNPSLLYHPGKSTSIILEGDFLYHRFTPDFGIGTIDNTIIPDLPRNRFFGTAWQYNITQQTTASASVRHNFNDKWKLNGGLSWQYYNRDYYGVERIQAAANGDWTRTLGRVLTFENYFTGQVNLNGKFTTGRVHHEWLGGFDADHYLTLNNDFTYPSVSGLPAGAYDKINLFDVNKFVQRSDVPEATNIRKRTAPVNRAGVYVQDLLKVTGKLNVLAGLRWSFVETSGIDSLNTMSGISVVGKNKRDHAFSPRIGVVYKPSTTTSVFASYSNSFVVNTGQDLDGNPVAPSIIDQYELGVKNELFHGLLSANITLYRIRNNNLAQTAPTLRDGTTNNNTNIKQLSGSTLSDGVEIDLASHPFKGLDIAAGYSYNYARFTSAPNSTGSNRVGETLVNNPKHTANATAFYTFLADGLQGLKFGASVLYIGDRWGGWNNTVNQSQAYSRLIFVKGYATIDLSAGYQRVNWSVMAKVSNITNTLNWNVHENYSVNPIAPTQFITTIAYRW